MRSRRDDWEEDERRSASDYLNAFFSEGTQVVFTVFGGLAGFIYGVLNGEFIKGQGEFINGLASAVMGGFIGYMLPGTILFGALLGARYLLYHIEATLER